MTLRPRPSRGDEGSALLIALFFATMFSVLVATVITFVDVGLRSSRAYDARAQSAYGVDSAVQAAIHRFRGGGPCDSYTAPLGPDGRPLDGQGVIVRCVDDKRPASGRATRPINALLSLGAEGISTFGEQRVLGNIFSNSTVTAAGSLIVQGKISAEGNCDPLAAFQTSPDSGDVHCANTDNLADATEGRDPGYTKAITGVPAYRSVPACPADPQAWLVTLEPGYYDDAAGLSALTNGGCPGRVVWLKPGNYYLDFTFRGGAGAWTVDDAQVVVVAGTPKGWNPEATTRPVLSVPGSCQVDTGPGVQVVAGGGTHLVVSRGRVEACAEPNTSDQAVALYGMGPDLPTHTLEPSDWTSVSRFTNVRGATTIGEAATGDSIATANLTATSPSASVTLTAFRPRVPVGSLIDSAALRVVHREGGDMDDASESVKVAANFPGSTCAGSQAVALPVSIGALVEHRVDLMAACGLTDATSMADLQVGYSAALKAGGTGATADLDGIAVEVAYREPTTIKPTAVAASTEFSNPVSALEIAEEPNPPTADAALDSNGPTAASLTVAGLGDPPIPPGSVIDSARLRVAHWDDVDEPGGLAPTVTVPFAGGTCTALPLPARPAGIADDRVDLKACGLDDPAELAGLTATYDVALAGGASTATARLDGMWLELVYRPPPLTRPPATVTVGPSPGSFSNPDHAKVIGESPAPLTADAVLNPASPTASLAFAGYDQPPVPAGSFIDAAVLRVSHQDDEKMDIPTLAVQLADGGFCPAAVLTRRAQLGEDRIDLKAACGVTDPAELAGLTVTYNASLSAGATTPPDATARVDGVVLDLAYRPATARRAATATATSPGFSNPDHAKVIGESATPLTADVTLNRSAPPAGITLTGYGQLPLPPGSVVDSAVLRVAHQADAWMGPLSLTTTFPGGSCPSQNLPTSPGGIGVTRSLDLATCGLTTAEQLAGFSATYTANAPTSASATQVPTTTSAVTGFVNPDNARAIDGVTSDAALDSGAGATSASVTLSGYNQPAVPAGSTIDSAILRFAHQESPGAGPVTVTVSFTNGTCQPQTFAPRSTLGEDTLDLEACGLTEPSQLGGLTVTYAANLEEEATTATARLDGVVLDLGLQASSATARVDGIELDVVFRAPTFRPLDGCLTVEPYDPDDPAAASCALVKVLPPPGDTATRFVAQGTVYTPSAVVDIAMAGLADQVLTRGVVARGIRLKLSPVPGYRRPLTGVPPEPVRFTAYPQVTSEAATATSPAPGFANPDNARRIDRDNLAVANLATADPSASISLSGFSQPLPAGVSLDGAVLRIVHREDVDVGSVTVNLAFDGLNATRCPQPSPLPLYPSATGSPDPPMGEDQIDLTACGLTSMSQLASLTVTYTATLSDDGATAATAWLDGITLDLLSGPLLRARVAFEGGRADVQGWSVLR